MKRVYSVSESEQVKIKNDLFFVEEVLLVLSELHERGELDAAPKESLRTLLNTSMIKLRSARALISVGGEIEEVAA